MSSWSWAIIGRVGLCVVLFNGVSNRPERYVLRWRPRERVAAARELP
jgi:hypothetical protein